MSLREFRLSALPLSGKLLCSGFLCAIGVGFLSALLNMKLAHESADGKPGLSFRDVVITFHGDEKNPLLVVMSEGKMAQWYEDDEQKQKVVEWARNGCPKDEYDAEGGIRSILEDRCDICHGEGGSETQFVGVDYKIVKKIALTKGISLARLARLTHIHILGIGMIFFLSGAIFFFTSVPDPYKTVLIVLPFCALFTDIGSWWLCKAHWIFAGTVILGGALSPLGFGIQFLASFYELWVAKPRGLHENQGGGEIR